MIDMVAERMLRKEGEERNITTQHYMVVCG
jgi:hypothetical protein